MANVPYAIGNKNPRNKNSMIIEFDASAVCVSVFGQFWMGYHGSVPLKTQILRLKQIKNVRYIGHTIRNNIDNEKN